MSQMQMNSLAHITSKVLWVLSFTNLILLNTNAFIQNASPTPTISYNSCEQCLPSPFKTTCNNILGLFHISEFCAIFKVFWFQHKKASKDPPAFSP